MKNSKIDQLDEEEKKIEEDLLAGVYVDVSPKEFDRLAQALAMRRKDATISIRINKEVLKKIKAKAKKYGIGYQTLIAEMIHRLALD